MRKRFQLPGKNKEYFLDIVPRWTVKTLKEFTPNQLALMEHRLLLRLAAVEAEGRRSRWARKALLEDKAHA